MPELYSRASKLGLVSPITVAAAAPTRRRLKLLASFLWLAASAIAAVAVYPHRGWLAGVSVMGLFAVAACAKLGLAAYDDWLARAELRRGRVDRAQTADQQLNSGVVLYEQGRTQEALEAFRVVATVGAPSVRGAAWLNVGLISEQLGLWDRAATAWDQSLAASYGLTVREASELSSDERLVLTSLSQSDYLTELQIQAATAFDRKQLRRVMASLDKRNMIEAKYANFIPRYRLAHNRYRQLG